MSLNMALILHSLFKHEITHVCTIYVDIFDIVVHVSYVKINKGI